MSRPRPYQAPVWTGLLAGIATLSLLSGCVGQRVEYEGSALQEVRESGTPVTVSAAEGDAIQFFVELPEQVTIDVVEREGKPKEARATIEAVLALTINETVAGEPRTTDEVAAWIQEHEDPDFDPAADHLQAVVYDLQWRDAKGRELNPITTQFDRFRVDRGDAGAGAKRELTVTAQMNTLRPRRRPYRVVVTLDDLELASENAPKGR